MTEILNVWIQSVWFWVATYLVGIALTYFILIKFEVNEKWENDDFDGNMLAAFVSFFWAFAIPTWLIISFIISAGNWIYNFAKTDHLTEDEQKELKKRQSK